MAQLASDIRGVMIPVTQAKVLLPNASVSEVITYGNPQPIEGAPPWVFGVITWRGWRIPLFSFSLLTEQAEEENFSGAKVAIIKALAGEGQMPFMALLAQGFPRLTAVTTENLLFDGDQQAMPQGVKHMVSVNDEPAFVPDLDGIENRLMEILGYREPSEPEPEHEPALSLVTDDLSDDMPAPVEEPRVAETLPEEPSEEELNDPGLHDPLASLDDDSEPAARAEPEEDPLAALDVEDDDDPLAGLDLGETVDDLDFGFGDDSSDDSDDTSDIDDFDIDLDFDLDDDDS